MESGTMADNGRKLHIYNKNCQVTYISVTETVKKSLYINVSLSGKQYMCINMKVKPKEHSYFL